MAFQVIRASKDCEVIVVAEITIREDEAGSVNKIDSTGRYYVYNNNTGQEFACVPEKEARSYFSGIANGLGFGEVPLKVFETLVDVGLWRRQSQEAWAREQLVKIAETARPTL